MLQLPMQQRILSLEEGAVGAYEDGSMKMRRQSRQPEHSTGCEGEMSTTLSLYRALTSLICSDPQLFVSRFVMLVASLEWGGVGGGT